MNDTICRLYSFGFTIELIAKSFDVIHPICHDNGISIEHTLNGRRQRGASIFLRARSGIDFAGQAQASVVNVVNFEAFHSRLVGFGDFLLQVLNQLRASEGLAAGWVARNENQL